MSGRELTELKSARDAADESSDSGNGQQERVSRRKHRRSMRVEKDDVVAVAASGHGSPRHRSSDELANLRKELDQLRAQVAKLSAPPALAAAAEGEGEGPYWAKESLWGKVSTFLTNNFTGHGLPQTAAPGRQPWFRRLFWLLMFLLVTAGLIAQIVPIIDSHVKKATGSVTSRIFSPGVRFPAVTICPQNPLKCDCDAWYESPLLADFGCAGDETANLTDRGLAALVASGFDPESYFKVRDTNVYTCGDATIKGRKVTTAMVLDGVKNGNLDGRDLLIYGGYAVDELVVECEFQQDGADCSDPRFWEPVFVSDRLCWSLNSAAYTPTQDGDPQFIIKRAGVEGSLYLVLQQNLPTYPSYVEEVGIDMYVHDQNTSVAYNPNVLQIAPQTSTRVGFTREEYTLLGNGFAPACVVPERLPYSSESCLETCWAQIVLQECGCQVAGLDFPNSTARTCSVLDNIWCADFPSFCYEDEITEAPPICASAANASALPCCGYRVERAFEKAFGGSTVADDYDKRCNDVSNNPQCASNCRTIQYSLAASNLNFNPGTILDEDPDDPDNYNFADVSRVTLLPSNLNVFKVEQIEATPIFAMLGGVGGTMGLYNGFSLLSIMELIEAILLVSICSLCAARRKKTAAPAQAASSPKGKV